MGDGDLGIGSLLFVLFAEIIFCTVLCPKTEVWHAIIKKIPCGPPFSFGGWVELG